MEKRSRQRVRDQVAHLAFGAETRMRSNAQRSNGFASMVERIYAESRRAVSGEARRSELRTHQQTTIL